MVVWSNTAYTWQFISQSSAGSSDYYAYVILRQVCRFTSYLRIHSIVVPGSNPPLVLYDRTTAGHVSY